MKNCFIALATIILLSSCAQSGETDLSQQSRGQVQQHIIKGKTTKAQIQKYLGSPDYSVQNKQKRTLWAYDRSSLDLDLVSYIPFVRWLGQKGNVHEKYLVIVFSQKGVVINYRFVNQNYLVKTGAYR